MGPFWNGNDFELTNGKTQQLHRRAGTKTWHITKCVKKITEDWELWGHCIGTWNWVTGHLFFTRRLTGNCWFYTTNLTVWSTQNLTSPSLTSNHLHMLFQCVGVWDWCWERPQGVFHIIGKGGDLDSFWCACAFYVCLQCHQELLRGTADLAACRLQWRE